MPRLHVWAVGLTVVPTALYAARRAYDHRISALADSERLHEAKHQGRMLLEADLQSLDGKYHGHQDASDLACLGGAPALMQRSMGRYHRILARADEIRKMMGTVPTRGATDEERDRWLIDRSLEQALEEEDAALLREEQLTYLPRRMQRAVLKQLLAAIEGRKDVSGVPVKVALTLGGAKTVSDQPNPQSTDIDNSGAPSDASWVSHLTSSIRAKLDQEAVDKQTYKTTYDLPPPSMSSPHTNAEKLAAFSHIQYLRWLVLEGYEGGCSDGKAADDQPIPVLSPAEVWCRLVGRPQSKGGATSAFCTHVDPLILNDQTRESLLRKLASIEMQKLLPNMNSIYELLAVDHGGHTGALLAESDQNSSSDSKASSLATNSSITETGPGVMGLANVSTILHAAGLTTVFKRNRAGDRQLGATLEGGATTTGVRHSDIFVLPKETVDHYVAGALFGSDASHLFRYPLLPLEAAILPPATSSVNLQGDKPTNTRRMASAHTYFGNVLTTTDMSTRIFQVRRGSGADHNGEGTFSFVPLDATAAGDARTRYAQLPMPTPDTRLQESVANITSSVPEMMPSSTIPLHPKAPFTFVQPIVTSLDNHDGHPNYPHTTGECADAPDDIAPRVGGRIHRRIIPSSLNAASITLFPTYQWLRSAVVGLGVEMKTAHGEDASVSGHRLLLPSVFRDVDGMRPGTAFFPLERNLSFTAVFEAINAAILKGNNTEPASANQLPLQGYVSAMPIDILYKPASTPPPTASSSMALSNEGPDSSGIERHPVHLNNPSPYYRMFLSPYLRFRETALTVEEETKSVFAYCIYAMFTHCIVPLLKVHRGETCVPKRTLCQRETDNYKGSVDTVLPLLSELVIRSVFEQEYLSCGIQTNPATALHTLPLSLGVSGGALSNKTMTFHAFLQNRTAYPSLAHFLRCSWSKGQGSGGPRCVQYADVLSFIAGVQKATVIECASNAATRLGRPPRCPSGRRDHAVRFGMSAAKAVIWAAIVAISACLRLCLGMCKAMYSLPWGAAARRTEEETLSQADADERGAVRDILEGCVRGAPLRVEWLLRRCCLPTPAALQASLAPDIPALHSQLEPPNGVASARDVDMVAVGDALLDASLEYFCASPVRLAQLAAISFLMTPPGPTVRTIPISGDGSPRAEDRVVVGQAYATAISSPSFLQKAAAKYVTEHLLHIDVILYVGTDRSAWRDPTYPRRQLLFAGDTGIATPTEVADASPPRATTPAPQHPAERSSNTVSELLMLAGSYLPERTVAAVERAASELMFRQRHAETNDDSVGVAGSFGGDESAFAFTESPFREHQVAAYVKEETGSALSSQPAIYTVNGRSVIASPTAPVEFADADGRDAAWIRRQRAAFVAQSLLRGCDRTSNDCVSELAFTPQLWIEELGLHAALPLPPLKLVNLPTPKASAQHQSPLLLSGQTAPMAFNVNVLPGCGPASMFDWFLHARNKANQGTLTQTQAGTPVIPVSTLGLAGARGAPLQRSDLFPLGRGPADDIPIFGYPLVPSPQAVLPTQQGERGASLKVSPVVCTGLHRCVHVDPGSLNPVGSGKTPHINDSREPTATLMLPFVLDPVAPSLRDAGVRRSLQGCPSGTDVYASCAATASMLLLERTFNTILGRYHIAGRGGGGQSPMADPFAFALPDVRLRPGKAPYNKTSIPASFLDTYFNPVNQPNDAVVHTVPSHGEDRGGAGLATPPITLLNIPVVDAPAATAPRVQGGLGSKGRKLFDDGPIAGASAAGAEGTVGAATDRSLPSSDAATTPVTGNHCLVSEAVYEQGSKRLAVDPDQRSVELRSWFLGRMMGSGYLDMAQGQADATFATPQPLFDALFPLTGPVARRKLFGFPSERGESLPATTSPWSTFMAFNGMLLGRVFGGPLSQLHADARTVAAARQQARLDTTRSLLRGDHEVENKQFVANAASGAAPLSPPEDCADSPRVTRRSASSGTRGHRRELSYMIMAPCELTADEATSTIPAATLEHVAAVLRGHTILNALAARSENAHGTDSGFMV